MTRSKTLYAIPLLLLVLLAAAVGHAGPDDWLVPWEEGITLVGTTYANHATYLGRESIKFARDFSLRGGCRLYAPTDGTVIRYEANWSPQTTGGMADYGNYVMFRPDDYGADVIMAHFETLDAGLAQRLAAGDMRIARGESLGYMGTTGNSTGTHLHFEIVVPEAQIASVFGKSVAEIMSTGLTGGGGGGGTNAPPGTGRIIMATLRQQEVARGDFLQIYMKTSDDVTHVELQDDVGTILAGTSTPTAKANGEAEWDFSWPAERGGMLSLTAMAYSKGVGIGQRLYANVIESGSLFDDGRYLDVTPSNPGMEQYFILILDTSGSMDGAPLESLKAAARTTIEDIYAMSARNWVAIITYDSNVNLAVPFATGHQAQQVFDAIDGLRSGGSTYMIPALQQVPLAIWKHGDEASGASVIFMSDGEPSDHSDQVVNEARALHPNHRVYTVGLFDRITGSQRVAAQDLMKKIASDETMAYLPGDATDFAGVFGDIITEISTGEKRTIVRIACPVDVTATYQGESLSSAADALRTRASFGTLQFEGADNEIKVLRLDPGADVALQLQGTGYGEMHYSVQVADDSGAYADVRVLESIPITPSTRIASRVAPGEDTALHIDHDGDGRADEVLAYGAARTSVAQARGVYLAPYGLSMDVPMDVVLAVFDQVSVDLLAGFARFDASLARSMMGDHISMILLIPDPDMPQGIGLGMFLCPWTDKLRGGVAQLMTAGASGFPVGRYTAYPVVDGLFYLDDPAQANAVFFAMEGGDPTHLEAFASLQTGMRAPTQNAELVLEETGGLLLARYQDLNVQLAAPKSSLEMYAPASVLEASPIVYDNGTGPALTFDAVEVAYLIPGFPDTLNGGMLVLCRSRTGEEDAIRLRLLAASGTIEAGKISGRYHDFYRLPASDGFDGYYVETGRTDVVAFLIPTEMDSMHALAEDLRISE